MTEKEIYQIWAPAGKRWVDWVRPVPFVEMDEYGKDYQFFDLTNEKIYYLDEPVEGAAMIVDLPGVESVKEGLALAKLGYRPIPIFNGTIEQAGARATVDNQSVGKAMKMIASDLEKLEIKEDALPAFLTDRNRLHRFKMNVALFDNSWDVYPQDLPTAEYFLENGINQIIVVSENIAIDLRRILYQFQKKGIQILFTKGYETPKKIRVRKPLRKNDY